MDSTRLNRILTRAKYELEKANLATTTNFEQAINRIVPLEVSNDLPGQFSGWIMIFIAPDQLILTFGNVITGQNFACYAASSKKLIHSIEIAVIRAKLDARDQREKMLNNHTCITTNKNDWTQYRIGEDHV